MPKDMIHDIMISRMGKLACEGAAGLWADRWWKYIFVDGWRKEMKKKVVISAAVIILAGAAIVGAVQWKRLQVRKKEQAVSGNLGQDCTVEEVLHETKKIYTDEYQAEADSQIAGWKEEETYSVESPLLVWNPYGTNTGAIYYYAGTETESYVICEITPERGTVLKNRLKNDSPDGLTTEHEYLVTGLAAGQLNRIKLSFYNESDRLLQEKTYTVKLKADEEIPDIINVEKGESTEELTEGLFAVLGHDKSTAKNIYYYDNDGVSRGRTPLNKYRTDRILTIDGNMVYSYTLSDIAVVNRLGKVIKRINLGKYKLHHDFMYDENKKLLLCLANDGDKDTIEDVLISVNPETGEVKNLIDFEVLLQDMRDISVQREGGKNTYGGTELDWLHLNSLDMINEKDAVFSSREESAIIKINNIYDKPSIDYLIHKGSLYKGTKYQKLLLKAEGTVVGPAGQHTITVEHDESLKKNQYYLFFYDNNFGSAKTLPDFDWSLYPGVGTYREGSASYFTKLLVDEDTRTYKMVQQFEVPYSSVVSGVNYFNGNITFSSGMDHSYGEYDKEGNMICTYTYEAERYAYRVIKYDFKDIFYQ